MSFWRTFGFHTVSAVDNILDREEFTLEELLDEEEILQECKAQNKKLLDYLSQPATLSKLFDYIAKEALEGADPKRRFKYPFLCCEILCSEIWPITEAIFRDNSLLNVLFSFLDKAPPLNQLIASYTSKVAITLLTRRTIDTINFVKQRENIIPKFINHLANASVMELLLKIISADDSSGGGVFQWVCSTDLIVTLVGKFGPEYDQEVHENASQVLMDIINIAAQSPFSPLSQQLESQAIVALLFQHALTGGSSLLSSLSVVIELLKRHARDVHDDLTPLEALPPLLKVAVENLENINTYLKTPPHNSMHTTVGVLAPPFGFHRLKVLEFLLALQRSRFTCIDHVYVTLDIMSTCLDLFFEFTWNNFLHNIVEQMIVTILEGRNEEPKLALFERSKLLDRIVNANRVNIQESTKPRSGRQGYMGFLTNISLTIANAASSNSRIEVVIEANAEWKNYVNTSLTEIRTIETKPLGGIRPVGPPVASESSEDEDEPADALGMDRYKLSNMLGELDTDDNNDQFDDDGFGDFTAASADSNFGNMHVQVEEVDSDSDEEAPQQQHQHQEEEEEWVEHRIVDPSEETTRQSNDTGNDTGNVIENDIENDTGFDTGNDTAGAVETTETELSPGPVPEPENKSSEQTPPE